MEVSRLAAPRCSVPHPSDAAARDKLSHFSTCGRPWLTVTDIRLDNRAECLHGVCSVENQLNGILSVIHV